MIEDTRGQEFIEQRERQLPADFSSSGDLQSQQTGMDHLEITPPGDPNLKFDVRSIFDSRPVNAYDFNISAAVELAAPGTTTFTVFTVPKGFVAIPRRWFFFIDPLFSLSSRAAILVTPQINNVDVQNNTDFPIGNESDDLLHTFFVVDELLKVTMRVVVADTLTSPILHVSVNGNFLAKRNVPPNFEIANPCGGCGEVVNSFAPPVRPSPVTEPIATQRFVPPPAAAKAAKCPPGQVTFKGGCAPCPPGTSPNADQTSCLQTAGFGPRRLSGLPFLRRR